MKARIVSEALNMAKQSRSPQRGSLIFHSDKGGQYKSKSLGRLLARHSIIQSMTGVNHCYDNATAESVFGTLKRELIGKDVFAIRRQAEAAILESIEVYYSRLRRHSSIAYRTPVEFEESCAS